MFLSEAPAQMASLRQAVAEDDLETVKRLAHSLKGTSGNMGAWRMSRVCAELQDIGGAGGGAGALARAPESLDRLDDEFDAARSALQQRTEGS